MTKDIEAKERLAYLLDSLLIEQNLTNQKNRLRSGYSSPSLRDISYETVRRISKQNL